MTTADLQQLIYDRDAAFAREFWANHPGHVIAARRAARYPLVVTPAQQAKERAAWEAANPVRIGA